jgi:hypothetical protein
MKIDHVSYNIEACKDLDFETFDKMFSQFAGARTKEHFEIIQKLNAKNNDNTRNDSAVESVGSATDSEQNNSVGKGRVGVRNSRPARKAAPKK